MSSDNPLEQVEGLIASDERQQPPDTVNAILKAIASNVPGTERLISLLTSYSEKQRSENKDLMLRTAWDELKRVSPLVDQLSQDTVSKDDVVRLILDATRKAEDLRDSERVKRIGRILAHAITLGPPSNFNKAEEMMRVARDLSDQDVLGLRHLYDTQFDSLRLHGLHFDVNEINRIWRGHLSSDRIEGVLQPEWLSIFLKLQGLGLATLVERIATQIPPNEQVFALLPKGADFVRYIQGAVGTPSAVSAA
jgi:hypothetical protein